jgi:hypothetical protein
MENCIFWESAVGAPETGDTSEIKSWEIASLLISVTGVAISAVTLTPPWSIVAIAGCGIVLVVVGTLIAGKIVASRSELRKATDRKFENLHRKIDMSGEKLDNLKAEISPVLLKGIDDLKHAALNIRRQGWGSFVAQGAIGLQKFSIELETHVHSDNMARFAIHSHLPSFIRSTELTLERGDQLYATWHPKGPGSHYYDLVNRRTKTVGDMLKSNAHIYDVFQLSSIDKYVSDKHTEHDEVEDPDDEILDRLNTLRNWIQTYSKNYHVYILRDSRKGPGFLLVRDRGVLIDIRTTEKTYSFEHSIDGVYTEDPQLLKEFERKFDGITRADPDNVISNREELLNQIDVWKRKVENRIKRTKT